MKDAFTQFLEQQGQRDADEARAAARARQRNMKTIQGCHNCLYRYTCEVSSIKFLHGVGDNTIVAPMGCGGNAYKADPKRAIIHEDRDTRPLVPDDGIPEREDDE